MKSLALILIYWISIKGYIRRASIEPSYSEEEFDKGKHINEDLR